MALLQQESELFVRTVLANPENSDLTLQEAQPSFCQTGNLDSTSTMSEDDNLFSGTSIFQNSFEDLDLEPIMGQQSSVMAQFS